MEYLIMAMIFAGSTLMVYNIVRYFLFLKKNNDLDDKSGNRLLLIVPLMLLVFFLIGYIVIGITRVANIMMASILLGGSIFVFLFLSVMLKIVGHVRNTEQLLANRYEGLKNEISEFTKDAFCSLIVNLSTDEIEDFIGEYLYGNDDKTDSYSAYLELRCNSVISDNKESLCTLMNNDSLIKHFLDGNRSVSVVTLIKMKDGAPCIVKIDATMTKKPVSDDIVAFIVERPYSDEIIKQTLFEKVLMDEYDKIACITNGNYRVLISNKKEGLLLSDEPDSYESIYYNSILPSFAKDALPKNGIPNPLRLSVIESELKEKGVYIVNAPFMIGDKRHYKKFVFYLIDEKAKLYLMLLSDSTEYQEEQEKMNKELSNALAKAVKSNEERIRFFSNVSHNVRTPLNGILGYIDVAKEENDSKQLKECFTKIEHSAKRLSSYLNDLLSMSLIDNGAFQLTKDKTNINSLIINVIKLFDDKAEEKNITIKTNFIDLVNPDVISDSVHLSHVVERLLENSVAFSPNDGLITVDVSQNGIDNNFGNYTITIKNMGIHIPSDVIDNIFELKAWDDLSVDETNDLPGVGLGMVVAKSFIDQMGGTIKVSSINEAIEFSINISLEIAKKETEVETNKALKLLVVDDNEINREIASLVLSADGFIVTLAGNGKEALDLVDSNPASTYDIIFMDIQMPVMNGYEASKAIRSLKDKEKANIPIIAMTASVYQEDQDAASESGMDGYVTKPIDISHIKQEINKVLKKRS